MNEHNQKHLTLSNRTYIEQELLQKSTFSSITKSLCKDPTTISKEVEHYYKSIPAKLGFFMFVYVLSHQGFFKNLAYKMAYLRSLRAEKH